jgi:hypothetical protein
MISKFKSNHIPIIYKYLTYLWDRDRGYKRASS